MNVFSSLPNYAGSWNLKSERAFSQEEISSVSRAEVVESNYGNSVCFHMVSGGMTFIPLSVNAKASLGDSIDMSQAKLLTLSKAGEADILRVEI